MQAKEGDSEEDEKFGLTQMKLEFKKKKIKIKLIWRSEEDRSAVENLSPHGAHYIAYGAEKKVKLRCLYTCFIL
uniref:Uncharacterized protein n=2 Tax=Helianthus annuus TaxID=4232 RepID=A0A251VG32_HELAN